MAEMETLLGLDEISDLDVMTKIEINEELRTIIELTSCEGNNNCITMQITKKEGLLSTFISNVCQQNNTLLNDDRINSIIMYWYNEEINKKIYDHLPACILQNINQFVPICYQIKLSKVDRHSLINIVPYLQHHNGITPEDIPKPIRSVKMERIVADQWDATYINNMSKKTVFKVITAANYLDIQSLLHLGCAKIATLIKGKSPEEIQSILANDEKKDDNKQEFKHGWMFININGQLFEEYYVELNDTHINLWRSDKDRDNENKIIKRINLNEYNSVQAMGNIDDNLKEFHIISPNNHNKIRFRASNDNVNDWINIISNIVNQ